MAAAIVPPVKSPAGGAVRPGAVTAVVCLALAAVVAAMASLNVALPGIARATHASQTQLAWIIDAYSLVFASLLLPAGAIGDRYGRRLALIAGLSIFGVASAVAMTASSAAELIGLRAAMGLGASLVMPATLSTITGTFASEQRTRAVSVWAAVAGGAAVLGLLVSGLVLEVWSWPSVFGLNVVLAVVALAGTLRFVPESADPDAPRLDVGGAILAAVGPRCWIPGSSPAVGWPREACRSSCNFSASSVLSSSSCSTCSSSAATQGWCRRLARCRWLAGPVRRSLGRAPTLATGGRQAASDVAEYRSDRGAGRLESRRVWAQRIDHVLQCVRVVGDRQVVARIL
jgi:MFS family permease